MIRKFQESDTTQVMEIWLNGNKDAHSFIPPEYWESHREMVREQLLQAEVYVYKTEGTIQGFIGIQDEHIAGIFVKPESRCAGIGKQLLDYAKKRHAVLTLQVYTKNRRAAVGFAANASEIRSGDPPSARPAPPYFSGTHRTGSGQWPQPCIPEENPWKRRS